MAVQLVELATTSSSFFLQSSLFSLGLGLDYTLHIQFAHGVGTCGCTWNSQRQKKYERHAQL